MAIKRKSTAEKAPAKPEYLVDSDHAKFTSYEFGGPVGCVALMTFFPSLFFYFAACLYTNDGQLILPTGDVRAWATDVLARVAKTCTPSLHASVLYFSLLSLQVALALVMPGPAQKGLPLPPTGATCVTYHCNAYTCLYMTIALVGTLHATGFVDLSEIVDVYGQLLAIASLTGFTLPFLTARLGPAYRLSPSGIYNYFMGWTLNPRLWTIDVKMFAEIRVSWTLLFMLTVGAVCKQYKEYGYVSTNLLLYTWGIFLYLNSCAKGEHLIVQTWDMYYEKFGWLLSYWNFAGVPFSYAYPGIYMATHDPATYVYPTWAYFAIFIALTGSHVLFDIANGQKSSFKALKSGTFVDRNTFPKFPGTTMYDAKVIKTNRGELLVSGLWGIVRKPNYTTDWIQAICWGLSAGFNSPIPYFYPVFHLTMLLHRSFRDNERCQRKYGKYWDEYIQAVPYMFIPYVL